MRQMPHMTVVVPADATEAYMAVLAAAAMVGPVYIRLGRYPTPVLFGAKHEFHLGSASSLRLGEDVVLFATGIMVAKALETADMLALRGIEAAVVNVSTIKPLDERALLKAALDKCLAVTIEEHSIIGGLGSAIAETLAESVSAPPLLRIGIRDVFGESGTADELLEHYGLTPSQMAGAILQVVEG
jgi:transketolase